jgi:hypothetical protein
MVPRFYHDHEFLEDGHTIETISVGIVAPDGAEYYAVVADAPWQRIKYHEWLMANVVPYLPVKLERFDNPGQATLLLPEPGHPDVKPSAQIAHELETFFVEHMDPDYDIQLAGWYSAYDHVSLMQFWGPMMSKPSFLPMWTFDLAQEVNRLRFTYGERPSLPKAPENAHKAIDDARWNRDLDAALVAWESKRGTVRWARSGERA